MAAEVDAHNAAASSRPFPENFPTYVNNPKYPWGRVCWEVSCLTSTAFSKTAVETAGTCRSVSASDNPAGFSFCG